MKRVIWKGWTRLLISKWKCSRDEIFRHAPWFFYSKKFSLFFWCNFFWSHVDRQKKLILINETFVYLHFFSFPTDPHLKLLLISHFRRSLSVAIEISTRNEVRRWVFRVSKFRSSDFIDDWKFQIVCEVKCQAS